MTRVVAVPEDTLVIGHYKAVEQLHERRGHNYVQPPIIVTVKVRAVGGGGQLA